MMPRILAASFMLLFVDGGASAGCNVDAKEGLKLSNGHPFVPHLPPPCCTKHASRHDSASRGGREVEDWKGEDLTWSADLFSFVFFSCCCFIPALSLLFSIDVDGAAWLPYLGFQKGSLRNVKVLLYLQLEFSSREFDCQGSAAPWLWSERARRVGEEATTRARSRGGSAEPADLSCDHSLLAGGVDE